VEEARSLITVRISDDTSLYLATLLTERARADRPSLPEDTLAELHARAANASPGDQAKTYRELGDRALYLLGYFVESLSRHLVSPDYYAQMGSAAYHRVDLIFKALFSDPFGPVFRELAAMFRECVRIVSVVRDAHRRDFPNRLMDLYEAWLTTGDKQLERELLDRGVLLPKHGIIES
jgi:hypothetical protein